MAVFTKEMCQKKLNTWLAAEEAIATWPRQRQRISTAGETAPIAPWPATYEEGAHGETEYP